MMTDAQAALAGQRLIDFLGLRQAAKGRHKDDLARYNTTWGPKTVVGLGRCVERIVDEARAEIETEQPEEIV